MLILGRKMPNFMYNKDPIDAYCHTKNQEK